MDIKERNNILEVLKCLTGSVMSYENIMEKYNSMTTPKRKYIYSKVHQVVKHTNMPFDKAQPLLVVKLNVLAAEENVDPAVALLVYIDKKNKKRH